ncbi:MAG TPA: type II secretion system protein [Victivallales bacterium]|nr:type II secretion system protein [Victivallales bacterium]HPO90977.1 type II secretion system protein [Victivallales bacterium]HRR06611.1 type II secretion system protein [Victivallales bacterium]
MQLSLLYEKKYYNFTLIELLIVIAVITILLALLFPSLQQAKLIAKQIVCASNMRQTVIAAFLYSQEHNGTYCSNYTCTDSRYVPWQTFLSGTQGDKASGNELGNGPVYLKRGDVYGCPANRSYYKERSNFGISGSGFGVYGGDPWGNVYKLNQNFTATITTTENNKPYFRLHYLQKIRSPENLVLYADCIKTGIYLTEDFPTSPSWEPYKGGFCEGRIHLHHVGNKANATFYDGHVKAMNQLELNNSASKVTRFISASGVEINL